jgi:hypothetical protein
MTLIGGAASSDDATVEKRTSSFQRLTERLSEASVKRRWEAYRDIDWDAAEHEIHPEDPRWEASAAWDPLATTEWFRDQTPERRAALGLQLQAGTLRVGIDFERVLSAGLLKFAASLPNGHPTFRYIYHEVSEEAQHSMMFQEFVNRSGVDPAGAGDHLQKLFDRVSDLGGNLPVLFFLVILGGEEAFDYVNRQVVRTPGAHPLLVKICRIHIIEETRHVSFARAFLRDAVPRVEPRQLREMRYGAGYIIDWFASRMFELTLPLQAALGIPADVYQAIVTSPQAQQIRRETVANMVSLCQDLGLVDPRFRAVWSRVTDMPPE